VSIGDSGGLGPSGRNKVNFFPLAVERSRFAIAEADAFRQLNYAGPVCGLRETTARVATAAKTNKALMAYMPKSKVPVLLFA
jgi:hypothetical protein